MNPRYVHLFIEKGEKLSDQKLKVMLGTTCVHTLEQFALENFMFNKVGTLLVLPSEPSEETVKEDAPRWPPKTDVDLDFSDGYLQPKIRYSGLKEVKNKRPMSLIIGQLCASIQYSVDLDNPYHLELTVLILLRYMNKDRKAIHERISRAIGLMAKYLGAKPHGFVSFANDLVVYFVDEDGYYVMIKDLDDVSKFAPEILPKILSFEFGEKSAFSRTR